MLILLPPSEGKSAAGDGPALDLAALSVPELRPARERVLDALVTLCAGPDDGPALTALGLSRHQGPEVVRNAGLRTAATSDAGRVYTGVLYDALGLASLEPAARRRAEASVLVFSGLWGVVRFDDRIPPYRCPVGATLPGTGPLGAFWRRALAGPLEPLTGDGLLLDLRSAAYAGTWRPTGGRAGRTAVVRVLHERIVDGAPRRTVVSHFNKATKGRLARDLLRADASPETPEALAVTLKELGHRVEGPVPGPGRVARLDMVVTEVGVGAKRAGDRSVG